jgi:hypothetical protein
MAEVMGLRPVLRILKVTGATMEPVKGGTGDSKDMA